MVRFAVVRRRYDAAGGAELYLQRLLLAMQAAGHRPEVIAEAWPQDCGGVRVHPVEAGQDRSGRVERFAAAVGRVSQSERFDCVLSLERGVPADVYRAGDGVHGVWIRHWRRWGRLWKRPLAGRGSFHAAMRAADARSFDPAQVGRVIVNSDMVRREIHHSYPAFPDDRIHLVRNGVNLAGVSRGDPGRWRARLGLADGMTLVVFAGSGWERKGLGWLLRAWRLLDRERFRLVVAGKGRRPLRSPAGVSYAGALAGEELRDLYAAADVFVLPTLYDPCANVCLEALAAGRPVITTRQNGAAELLREGINGSVVPHPAATAALAAAIQHWARHPRGTPVPVPEDVSMERNLRETLAVLELAAGSRFPGPGTGVAAGG